MMRRGFGPEDEYGVPTEIFGVHDPDFFPLLGRVIALSSVNERNMRELARKLVIPERCNIATTRTSEVLKEAKKGLGAISNEADRKLVSEYLNNVESCLSKRDAYAHSLWPAISLQHGTRVVGWRIKPGTSDLHLGDDFAELRQDVLRFSELVMRWNLKIHLVTDQLRWLQPIGETS
ncbi:MAG: hypothetical protein EPN48_15475 [Microbacteriaceae bacterium]|nr:MAG: hypothetical protein EPN48_15475 [Microbacteriaceae bacterium]